MTNREEHFKHLLIVIGKEFQSLMVRYEVDLDELAKRTGIDRDKLAKILQGTNVTVHLSEVVNICCELKCRLDLTVMGAALKKDG
jgi:DNA-binding Xre family transcriptional regulator